MRFSAVLMYIELLGVMKGTAELWVSYHKTAPDSRALEQFENEVVPFDVPGHKRGRGTASLPSFWASAACRST